MSQLEQLQSRLARLQNRVYRAPVGDAESAPLDARLDELRRRVRRCADRPVEADDVTLPSDPPASLSQNARRLRQSLLEAFSQLEAAAEALGEKRAITLEGSLGLARLAVQLVDDRRDSVAEQLALVPALEEILGYLRTKKNALTVEADRRRRNAELVGQTVQLHEAAVAGRPLELSWLRQVAAKAMTSAETEVGRLTELPKATFAERTAAHCVDVARTIAFLTEKEVRWRAFQAPMTIAALLQDAGRNADRSGASGGDDRHPLMAEIALEQTSGFDRQFAVAAGCHHERLDGSGFPRRLSGERLSAPARLLAIAEAYCSFRRQFRDQGAQGARAALMRTLAEAEAGRLDIDLAALLLDLGAYPTGTKVELASGEIAEVVANQETARDPKLAALPIVRIVRGSDGKPATGAIYRNLARRAEGRIVREAPESEL